MDLPKGHLQREEKRECDEWSRSFQFDSYRGTYVDSNSSTHAEWLANPNSPFVTETENSCLSFTSHKNSEPLVQATNTCKVTNHLNFSWTSGLSSWASDLSNSLAQCLVSRSISVKHWSRAVCFSSAFWWRYISCLLSWFLLFAVRLQQARSLAGSSQLFGSISHALRSHLQASMNCRAGRLTFLTPVVNCLYKTSLGMRPSFLWWTWPSHLRWRLLRRESILGIPVMTI